MRTDVLLMDEERMTELRFTGYLLAHNLTVRSFSEEGPTDFVLKMTFFFSFYAVCNLLIRIIGFSLTE